MLDANDSASEVNTESQRKFQVINHKDDLLWCGEERGGKIKVLTSAGEEEIQLDLQLSIAQYMEINIPIHHNSMNSKEKKNDNLRGLYDILRLVLYKIVW